MESAFGVDHGYVSKSYVPGNGWLSATSAGTKTLKKIPPGRFAGMRGPLKSDTKYKRHSTDLIHEVRGAIDGMKPGDSGRSLWQTLTYRGKDARNNDLVDIADRSLKFNPFNSAEVKASATRLGGKSGGIKMMTTRENAYPQSIAHEEAHLAPNRSGYRLKTISRKPNKIMREEARADAFGDRATRGKDLFKRPLNDVLEDDSTSLYGQLAVARDHEKRGLATRQVEGLTGRKRFLNNPLTRKAAKVADQAQSKQIASQITDPGLKDMNSLLKVKKPVKRKGLSEYKRVYNKA